MADCAHDVRLMAVIIDSIAHGFSVNGQRFVVLSIGLVPALEGTVQMQGLHANEHITDDRQARYAIAVVVEATAETPPGLLSQTFGPIRDGQIAAHATQGSACSNG